MMHERALEKWGYSSSQVNVVHYEEVEGCHKMYPGLEAAAGEIASITGPMATFKYWDRKKFAHVVVQSPTLGSHDATVKQMEEPVLEPKVAPWGWAGLGAVGVVAVLANSGHVGAAIAVVGAVTFLH